MTQTTPKGIWIITDETVEVKEGKGGADIGADYGDAPSDDRAGCK
jgi:hypothetical protein